MSCLLILSGTVTAANASTLNDGAAAVEDQLLLVISAFPTWIDLEREWESKREKDELLAINSKPQIYFLIGMGGWSMGR